MKISTRATYGVRLMLELGLYYGQGPVYLKNIARAEDISEKYLSQIIIPLKNSDLVNSFRGAHGGYSLARAPKDITMKSIVEILEGGFDLVRNKNISLAKETASISVTNDLWEKVGNKIASTLGEFTLEDLIEQYKKKQGKEITYNI